MSLSRAKHEFARVRRRGLGLIEAMISLAISASLLTAVAAAYTATTQAIETNDQFARATQTGRVSVNLMMADARRASSGVVDADSLEVMTTSGERRIYAYDAVGGRLTLTFPDAVTPTTRVLARNVQNATFVTDGQTISMTVTIRIGDNRITLSGSAMPRRTISYH